VFQNTSKVQLVVNHYCIISAQTRVQWNTEVCERVEAAEAQSLQPNIVTLESDGANLEQGLVLANTDEGVLQPRAATMPDMPLLFNLSFRYSCCSRWHGRVAHQKTWTLILRRSAMSIMEMQNLGMTVNY
jgi:hypothetical protein